MKNPPREWLAIMAIMGVLAAFNCASVRAQTATDPVITCHPQTLAIQMDNEAKLKVRAENPGPLHVRQTLMYQWQIRGPGLTNFVDIPGATNDTLTFTHVTTNEVAYYRVKVTGSNSTNTTTSEPAQLLVWTTNSPLLVYGSPIVRSVSLTDCPGSYVGVVNYVNGSAWGWQGSGTLHKATDNNLSDTKVEAYGYEDDRWCDLSPLVIPHTGPPPYGTNREDSKYVFSIYFPTGFTVPTSAYPLTLSGFKP